VVPGAARIDFWISARVLFARIPIARRTNSVSSSSRKLTSSASARLYSGSMSLPRRAAAHAPFKMNVTTPVPVSAQLNAARDPRYCSLSAA
jgi:hypothetical protein